MSDTPVADAYDEGATALEEQYDTIDALRAERDEARHGLRRAHEQLDAAGVRAGDAGSRVDMLAAERDEARAEVKRLRELLKSEQRAFCQVVESKTAIVKQLDAATASRTDPEALAQRFHETYELLAPHYGYETREASRKPWADVPEKNRELMIAVCAHLLREGAIA